VVGGSSCGLGSAGFAERARRKLGTAPAAGSLEVVGRALR
jgi:hypothetical protein